MTEMVFNSLTNTVTSTGYLEATKEEDGFVRFNIAHGYNDETVISFVNENVRVRVKASGEVAFFDAEDRLLAASSVPADSEGRGCYLEVSCKVDGDGVVVRFPEYAWYDNYPHCDGESDRWDAKIVGYKPPIVFRFSTETMLSTTE